jgi:uncharacterized membrane protein YfcA
VTPAAADSPAPDRRGFFASPVFRLWYGTMMALWLALFAAFAGLPFLFDHLHYPAVMLLGAFVAGLTPEGGGAVAFPVLSVFFAIDRAMARDFSLMIQSIGMTSASIWILSRNYRPLHHYRVLLWCVPLCFTGFVLGMALLQAIPVVVIQALFLSFITAFAIAYTASGHRNARSVLALDSAADRVGLGAILLVGGMCASLFGTGADILLYTLLVTRFRLDEKYATHLSIMLMAAISLLGFGWRHFWDGGISAYQVGTWLCAWPVVLLMAPLGSFVLGRLEVAWMLRAVVVLNVLQLAYFNLRAPSLEKLTLSLIFGAALLTLFWRALAKVKQTSSRRSNAPI